jgi:hypothetical protein
MARYAAFLGLQVEVQYRAGDILLPASGTFVGDTGRSVFLEQIFEQRGQHRNFRWEIPYQYIVKLARKTDSDSASPSTSATTSSGPSATSETPGENARETNAASSEEVKAGDTENATAAAVGFTSQITMLFPRPHRSEG